jgi:hypothetical protein
MHGLQTYIRFLCYHYFKFRRFSYVEFIFLNVWFFVIPYVWFMVMYLLCVGEIFLMISGFIQGRKQIASEIVFVLILKLFHTIVIVITKIRKEAVFYY